MINLGSVNKIKKIDYKENNKALYVLIYEQLYNLIKEGVFIKGEKLPGENALAKKMGVSRGSLRQALLILQEDGLITNVHGKGNYVTKNNFIFGEGLEKIGNVIEKSCKYEYKVSNISIDFEAPNKMLANKLHLSEHDLIVTNHILYSSKEKYISLGIYFIPFDILKNYNINSNSSEEVKKFIDKSLYIKAAKSKLNISITRAGEFISDKLNLTDNKTLLLINEELFDKDENPLAFNKIYCKPNYFEINFIRCS
ncbi:MAG: GntR family transcriptional regulator [Halanaerobiales bacterium]